MLPLHQLGVQVGDAIGVCEQTWRGVVLFDVMRLGSDYVAEADLEYAGRTLRLRGWRSYLRRGTPGRHATVVEVAECEIIAPDGGLPALVVGNWALTLLTLHGQTGAEFQAASLADAALDAGDVALRRLWLDVLAALAVTAGLPWPAVPRDTADPGGET